jgi:PAS domain S-box-containing protein
MKFMGISTRISGRISRIFESWRRFFAKSAGFAVFHDFSDCFSGPRFKNNFFMVSLNKKLDNFFNRKLIIKGLPGMGLSKPYSFLLAPVVVLAVAGVQHLILPRPDIAPFLFLFPAVVIVTLFAGFLPGLLAAAISAFVGNFFFIEPYHSFSSLKEKPVVFILFFISSFFLVLVGSYFRRTMLRLSSALEKINKSEKLFKKVREIGNIGSWEIDLSRKAMFWSDEVYGIFGMKPGKTAVTYEDFYSIVHPDDLEKVQDLYSASVRGGKEIFEAEHRITRPDGEVRVVYQKCDHIRDEEGRVVRSVGMVQDITERKRSETALRETENDLNRAQKMGKIGSWRLDVTRNELVWSEENHRIFGLEKDEPMTYETFLSCVHPDDIEYVDKKWKAGLAGEPYDIEHRIMVEGKEKWVRERAELEFDEKGNLIGGFGTTQDITERKKIEKVLREQADQYNAILGATTDGFWLLDDNLNLIDVNDN